MTKEEIEKKNGLIKKEINAYYQRRIADDPSLSLDEQFNKCYQHVLNFYEDYYDDSENFIEFIKEQINEIIMSIDDETAIFESGYKPWLSKWRDKICWDYSDRYSDYLLSVKDWSLGTVKDIQSITDDILDHCGNPMEKTDFSVKGLVVGDIQSGKTANYTGLINKAIDAQYKLIIVLAGLTNDLRSQTQKRLDKEVLGYETKPNIQRGEPIGVGKVSSQTDFVTCLTQSDISGDLKKLYHSVPLSENHPAVMFVVKKNVTVLKALIDFIESNPIVKNSSDLKLHVPTLIIDDEADQASINTHAGITVEEATTTNRLIRTLLSKCSRYSYIGYTATPFANIFIPAMQDEQYKDSVKDLFPDNFIICLKTPDNYCGVKQFFGIEKFDDGDNDNLNLDLYKQIEIDDIKEAFPTPTGKTKKDTEVEKIPESLKEAIKHFLIASGVKFSRGINQHNSMLVHITKHVCPNEQLKEMLEIELNNQTKGFKFVPKIQREYKKYWEKYIKPISKKRLGDKFNDNWSDVSKGILKALNIITRSDTVQLITGDSEDVIDFSEPTGMHIIVGGDKLSRGLTLDGLIVSYYFRNTQAFDTLLQMGRWFGYREGWLDLCRVYTTKYIINDFINAAEALDAFKSDIRTMNDQHYTPMQFGLKVRHSSKLMPTAANKRKHATETKITFSGDLQQTISFSREAKEFNRNLTKTFLTSLGEPVPSNEKKMVYHNIPVNKVLDFLKQYKECLNNGRTRISVAHWINYIEKLNKDGELVNWTIVLHSLRDASEDHIDSSLISGATICKPSRKSRIKDVDGENYLIKALTNPADFLDFFDEDDPIRKDYSSYKAGDPIIMERFSKENALLTIYDIDIVANEDEFSNEALGEIKRKSGKTLEGGDGLIGLGVWFPISPNEENSAIPYLVNEVYQKMTVEQNEASQWTGDNNE